MARFPTGAAAASLYPGWRSNSLASRPGFRTGSAHHGREDGAEERAAVGGAEQRVDRVLGMRHEADNVPTCVGDAGDVALVEDVDGNLFLDCNAGVAVCSTGHCHPDVVKAIKDQAEQLIHICGTDYYYRHMPQLAEKFDAIVPIKSPTRTHFANSGTEAVETALKLAMHATGREKFIGFFNSFHGRTLGSLSLTSSKAAQRRGFKRQALDVVHVPYPNEFRNPFNPADCGDGGAGQGALNWIEERLFKTTTPPEEVAGIVVEAVQGEGGYVPAPKNFLRGLRRICDQHGIMLIVDEVQSGMGRTGKMFACEHYDVQADIVCIAKGIGSGLPIGACEQGICKGRTS